MEYLPIFVNLKNKPVLVIGGGNVAARKIDLLIQTSANIFIICSKKCFIVKTLFKEKKIKWLSNEFHEKYLKNIFLIIAATDNDILNKKIFDAANKHCILVNVVDDKKKCSFIFPSIVDRSPIIVAIASNGLTPVLSKLIREKLEILLPKYLGNMAKIAAKWRNEVKKYFKKISDRRNFWEKLFNGLFASYIASGNIKKAEKFLNKQMNDNMHCTGEIILVGAGPGDPGLLTIRGLQIMQTADFVLYDCLVSNQVLNLSRKDAIKICVGKRSGKPLMKQNKINDLMIKLAKRNKKVIRLKGGDPFIFGRGGEELEIIKKSGIPFQVVPGITAAIGASAYSGIPLTHRKYSNNILFITGHSDNIISNYKLFSVKEKKQTIVIYMGVKKAIKIIYKLISYGMLPNTPVAIISHASKNNQKVIIGILKNITYLIKNISTPAIIIIGKVVNLQNKLNWFKQNNNHKCSFINLN